MANYVTLAEAAESSIYSHVHLSYLLRKKLIEGRKSGNIWLVDLDSLREYEAATQALGKKKHTPKNRSLRDRS